MTNPSVLHPKSSRFRKGSDTEKIKMKKINVTKRKKTIEGTNWIQRARESKKLDAKKRVRENEVTIRKYELFSSISE